VIVARSVPLTDEAQRRRERARAYRLLSRAKELGVKDDFVEYTINLFNPDGSPKEGAGDGFSKNREAEGLMRAGEAAFARGDYGAALGAYERAFALDPTLYHAPLFAGDAHLQRKEYEKAAEWYARAVRLQPDTETAYRYWGNALLRQGRHEEAREKYVGAIIADPYNGYVWPEDRAGRVGHADERQQDDDHD
jgi:tetratricopeptide (TPR) repeat protein